MKTTSIRNSPRVVSLSISAWEGRRQDKKVTAEVTAS
jgi:hypothetical protein